MGIQDHKRPQLALSESRNLGIRIEILDHLPNPLREPKKSEQLRDSSSRKPNRLGHAPQ